ncbi:MAG: hypothetical protein HPY70_14450 [Firmicutes bacterium]|nr:hypothetical protein [Bacillota bacterium]
MKRAQKDRADRERLIEKAQPFLLTSRRSNPATEANKRDEQFDGYYGIQANDKNMSAEEVLAAYQISGRLKSLSAL